MSGVSSIGSSMTAASYRPLDKNQDGVVDAQELQQAAQSGLLSASILNDEDSGSSSDPSATDIFSGNLASMLLQMQQAGQSGSSTSSSSSDQSPMDQLFASLDTNQDGKITQSEFVAGRPKDMSESDAESLFKSIDRQSSGSLTKDQFAVGLDALKSSDVSAADMLSLEPSSDSSNANSDTAAQNQALDVLLSEMQNPSALYQNTYGQYDPEQSGGVSA